MTLFDCLGPAEGFDIGIVKINETQLAHDNNLNRLRQWTSSNYKLHAHWEAIFSSC